MEIGGLTHGDWRLNSWRLAVKVNEIDAQSQWDWCGCLAEVRFCRYFIGFLPAILRLFTDALLLAEAYFFFPLMFSLYIRCNIK